MGVPLLSALVLAGRGSAASRPSAPVSIGCGLGLRKRARMAGSALWGNLAKIQNFSLQVKTVMGGGISGAMNFQEEYYKRRRSAAASCKGMKVAPSVRR